jgi:hypothetical protein
MVEAVVKRFTRRIRGRRYRAGWKKASHERQLSPRHTRICYPIMALLLVSCDVPSETLTSDREPFTLTPALSTSGKTFFLANAESGTVKPPWDGPVFGNGGMMPVTSTGKVKNGSRAFKFEIPATTLTSSSSTVMAYCPQVSMGSPQSGTSLCAGRGRFMSGYYSLWVYVDAGFTSTAWNSAIGWMTGVAQTPSPISYIGFERWNATTRSASAPLQVVFLLKNCQKGQYVCPKIPGYAAPVAGHYRMTASSPAGIVTMPRQRWVHLSIYYKMARTYGQVTIWQDGTKIMDLTAPTMNTFGGHCCNSATLTNAAGDMKLQHFLYGGAESATRRIYVDDFRVTEDQVLP